MDKKFDYTTMTKEQASQALKNWLDAGNKPIQVPYYGPKDGFRHNRQSTVAGTRMTTEQSLEFLLYLYCLMLVPLGAILLVWWFERHDK